MHIRTRRILFWFAVLVFCIVAFVTVWYAQGYAYDFSTGRFVRTGAITVSANTDAKLFVDDEFVGSLSLVGHNAGKTRLQPGSHTVRLVRDGWSAWNKEVIVEEGFLTDFPHILLLPTDEEGLLALQDEASRSLIESFTLAPRTASVSEGEWILEGTRFWHEDSTASRSLIAEKVLGFQPENGHIFWWTRNEVWILWTKDVDEQPSRMAGDRELLARWSVPIQGAAWFRDRYHIVVDLGMQGYRMVEIDTRGGTNIVRF